MSLRRALDRLLGDETTLRRRAFARLRWTLSIPPRDWLDPERRALLAAVRPRTMLSYRRLSSLYDLCREAEREGVPGAFVECGVWRGGAGAVMAKVAGPGRKTWLFDSFEGLPSPTAADGPDAPRWTGRCAAPIGEVERFLFGTLGLDRSRVFLRKGWFDATLPADRADVGPVALLRLDADWYESTRTCLGQLYDNVSPGGWIVVDDYGFWEGSRRAVDGFLAARGLRPEIRRIDRSGAWFRKP